MPARTRCISERRASAMVDEIPRFLDGRVAVPAAGAAHRGHAPHLLTVEGPKRAMAAVRADPLRARHEREREYEFASVGVFAAEGDSWFPLGTWTACGYRCDQLGAARRRRERLGHHAPQHLDVADAAAARAPARSRHLRTDIVRQDRTVARRLRCRVRAWPAPGRPERRLTAGLRRGMDIGTSKIKPSQMRGFEHRLLDVAELVEAVAGGVRADGDELASLAASGTPCPSSSAARASDVQSVLDGWDLTGTGTLRRSLQRDFPRGDVEGAYHVLARLAPEAARRVHPGNYEAILNTLVRRMAGHAGNKVAMPFAFAVYGLDRGEAETDQRIEITLDTQIRDRLLEEIAELDCRYRLVEQARRPGAGATWHCKRTAIASSSAWPRVTEGDRRTRRRPPCRRPNRSTRPHLGDTSTPAVVVPASLAPRGSTIDQR